MTDTAKQNQDFPVVGICRLDVESAFEDAGFTDWPELTDEMMQHIARKLGEALMYDYETCMRDIVVNLTIKE